MFRGLEFFANCMQLIEANISYTEAEADDVKNFKIFPEMTIIFLKWNIFGPYLILYEFYWQKVEYCGKIGIVGYARLLETNGILLKPKSLWSVHCILRIKPSPVEKLTGV